MLFDIILGKFSNDLAVDLGTANTLVYVRGKGIVLRETDRIVDWYPDGKQLLFTSSMNSGRQRFSQFYRVAPAGGLPEVLPIPFGEFAASSADGKTGAYTPQSTAFRTWKRYRGGWAAHIWLFDLPSGKGETLTHDAASDELPMWAGRKLYFLSDRGDEQRSNIWSYDLDSKQFKQVTTFKDYDSHFPAIGPGNIVFENGGKLYLLDLATDAYSDVKVQVVTDAMALLPRNANAAGLIEATGIAPDGKRPPSWRAARCSASRPSTARY